MMCIHQGEARLSVITNENGGIIDDTVITNAGDYIYMVVNGATKAKDLEHIHAHMARFGGEVQLQHLTNLQLYALQVG